jgi:hypothetical protein
MGNELRPDASPPMIPMHAQAKQATMRRERFAIGAKVDLSNNIRLGRPHYPHPAPSRLPNGKLDASPEHGFSLCREHRTAGKRLEVTVTGLAVVGQMLFQIGEELVKLLRRQ